VNKSETERNTEIHFSHGSTRNAFIMERNLIEYELTEVPASPKAGASPYEILGVVLAIVGFMVLMAGALMILKIVTASTLATDVVTLSGLVLVVLGCGIFGTQWSLKPVKGAPLLPPSWSIILTLISTVVVSVVALWAYVASNNIWTAVSAGALGGLVHEIAQSKGTAFLPDSSSTGDQTDNPSAGAPAPPLGKPAAKTSKTNEESYLGGLLGIILGGAAGLLTISVSSSTVSAQFVVTAFSAGVAFKGISDAAASPPKS
jgi:hypothetical protein